MAGLFAALLGGSVRAEGEGQSLPRYDDDFWFTGDPRAASFTGRYVTPELAMRVSTVYACRNLLAKTVAALPLRMYRIDGNGARFEAPDHPLNDLLEHQPNSWQTAFDFKAFLMGSLCMRGNAYAEIVPGARGAVDALEPLHPDRVKPERLPDRTIRYKISEPDGRTRVLLQDEMFHIRSAISDGGLVGCGPIEFARETIGLAMATEEHGARLFGNGARPAGVVQLKSTMSDESYARFKREWNSIYSGLANAGKTAILEEGAEFKPIALNSEDAQFIATRMFQIEEIARWFDVPLVLLHHVEKTTSWGTGVEAIMLAFVRNNLMPWLVAIQQAARRDLILAPRSYMARFDVESLLTGDSKAQAEFFNKLVLSGILVRNEAREALGYNPLDGLDKPLQPVNATTTDNAPVNRQGGAGAAPDDGEEEDTER